MLKQSMITREIGTPDDIKIPISSHKLRDVYTDAWSPPSSCPVISPIESDVVNPKDDTKKAKPATANVHQLSMTKLA